MRRRDFLGVIGSSAVIPSAARGQQLAIPVIGFLHASAPETNAHLVAAFRKGLGEAGFIEGRNVVVEYLWAHNDAKQFSELAAELVRRQVAVIVTPVNTAMAQAAKAATTTIPIVFSMGTDAVKAGLIVSYNRPGGKATGVSAMVAELGAKRLGLLLELRPQTRRIGLLVNPSNPFTTETSVKDVGSAASAGGVGVDVLAASTPREIGAVFEMLGNKPVGGLLVSPDPLFNNRRIQLATFAARYMVPTIAPLREFVEAGGLMNYGPSDVERYRQVGIYAGRILKGEKPADMPVQQPTTFELVLNMQTARALNIEVPATLIARADEVIE